MEKSGKKGLVALVVILVLIIIGLVCYIVCGKNAKTTVANAGENKGILVLDDTELKDEYSSRLVLKIKNTSDKPIIDVTPKIIYRDANNMPFHEAWGSKIKYFAPGDERCVEFYDPIQDYDNIEIGMVDGDEEKLQYKDMRDQVSFETKLDAEPDEDGNIKLHFDSENKSDEYLVVEYQIEYYDGDKLIFEDQFISTLPPKQISGTYEYYETMFYDGTPFPEGYTYVVKMTEAVQDEDSDKYNTGESDENIEEDGVTEISGHRVFVLAKDAEGLKDEDIVERILFRHLKNVFGNRFDSAKIYVDKVYKKGDKMPYEGADPEEGDILFEATLNIFPSEGTDPNIFTIPNGEYDEDLGYVKDVFILGTIKVTEDGDYYLENFGTGW